MRTLATRALLATAFAVPAAGQDAQEAHDTWVVRAGVVHTAAGDAIENGSVVVEGGKIAAVGPGGGRGDDVLECAAVTPGLVDLSVGIGTGTLSVEQSSETAVDARVVDALDLFSYRWQRELESGVTTVMVHPADFDVIGGTAVVLKTGGPPDLEQRIVLEDACLRAAMGTKPSAGNSAPWLRAPATMYFRRPTTRMGVEWVFRKTFYDALAVQRSGETLEGRAAERQEILSSALAGDLPVFVHAPATQDVRTALFLKEEFGLPRLVLDHAVEAWKEPELLARSGAAVVLPPFPAHGRIGDPHANDSYFLPIGAAAQLHELGVTIALSSHGAENIGSRLARQAGYAMRGGLPFEAALAAVTRNPATLAGVEDRVGTIEVGKDADLVLWSGPPFEPSSGIVGVIASGELVVDRRPTGE